MHASPFEPALEPPALAPGSVHVWLAHTETLALCARHFDSLIDDEERTRGNAYHAAADRMRHLITRGVLRTLAGHYLTVPPADVRFAHGEFGKPRIASPHGAKLSFNVSHSGDVVLLAFTRDGDVGVDVERWNPRLGATERARLGDSVFSTTERTAIGALSSAFAREGAFYSIWSRKEAYLKGTGAGISAGLSHVDVSAGETARLIADRRAPMAAQRWSMCDVDVGPGYSAALAWSAAGASVELLVASPQLFSAEAIP
ncbi:4'-phosphopantetheinyl transferase superfamily protein [soil metagenome]